MNKRKRFCGNCGNHNSFVYPTIMFCSTRYAQNKDLLVDTMWSCGDWKPVAQECPCVRDALKKNNGEWRNAKVIT